MSSCRSSTTKFFEFFDLFSYSTFLRYRGDAEYTTATGGILSLGVIAISAVLFASMGLKTVNKEIIYSSQTI